MQAAKEKNVLMVSHAGCLGGAERSLLELACALKETHGFRPCICSPRDGGLREDAARLALEWVPLRKVRLEGLRGIRQKTRASVGLLQAAIGLVRAARKRRACLIHANGIKACLASALAARLAGIPCLWHVRDYPRHPLVIRTLLRHVHGALAGSTFLAGAVRAAGRRSTDTIRVIPNGVAAPAVEPHRVETLRAELPLANDELLITMVAQMVPWKRHDLFFDAAELLGQHRPRLHFLTVGGDLWNRHPGYRQDLEQRTRQGDLAGRISMWGQRSDIGAILAASDMLVLPSDSEPFGRVIIEAWHVGTPVIVSDGGGPEEIVADEVTGLHFRQGNREDLARAIAQMASNKVLRLRLAQAGRQEAQRYDPVPYASAVAKLYRELLA